MAKFTKTYWTNRVELPLLDLKRLKFFIEQERQYYNSLVSGFAGPLRTMPATIAQTAEYEALLVEAARLGTSIRALKIDSLPIPLQRFKAVLFDETGKTRLDDRMLFLSDILATTAPLSVDVRRDIAQAMLREVRRQSRMLNETPTSDVQAMPALVEALSIIEPVNKRHVQVPRSAIKVSNETKDEITVKLPYFDTPLTVSKPNAPWHYAFVRVDFDGNLTLDLSQEHEYNLRRIDRTPRRT